MICTVDLTLVIAFCSRHWPRFTDLRCLAHSADQEGTAVQVVDQITQRVVLSSSLQSNGLDHVHSHLAHPTKDVFYSHSYPAAQCVRRLLFFCQRVPSAALEHDAFLAGAFF